MDLPRQRLDYAKRYVQSLEKRIKPFIDQVANGPFATSVMKGTFPIDGIRFVHTNHYHLIMNDMGNLNLYVAKARDEEEMLFFHFMAAEEKNHLQTLFLLTDALGIDRDDLRSSEPYSGCLLRTNYFSRLAQYGTPGEIALGILLNFPVWAAGAKNEAIGLRGHYGLGKKVPGTDKRDTDILNRFAAATKGFTESAMRIMARDMIDEEAEEKMTLVGMWSVEYEAMVWDNYYKEGLRRGLRSTKN